MRNWLMCTVAACGLMVANPAEAQTSAHQGMLHATPQNAAAVGEPYSDKSFLSGMIAHHEGAIDMADEVLKSPKLSDKVKKWAEDIRKAQTKEIELMRNMLQKVGGMDEKAYKVMKDHMSAMLTAQKSLADPEMGFISEMTPHHAGAVEMSLPALMNSADKDIRNLAQDIISDQTEEIHEFRTWMEGHGHKMK